MRNAKLDEMILQLENYIECWKQFNHYLSLARAKKFEPEDEDQFLEVKSVMTQQLEMIMSGLQAKTPTKEEVLTLISSAPSLRFLTDSRDDTIRTVENSWHRIYIGWQSILGQLKVQQRELEGQSRFKWPWKQ